MGEVYDLGAKKAEEEEEEGISLTLPQAIALGKYHVRSFADCAEVLQAAFDHLYAIDMGNASKNLNTEVRVSPVTAMVGNALTDLNTLRVDKI